jgi:hypothetical protein
MPEKVNRNKRAERWRGIAAQLRLALISAAAQLVNSGIPPSRQVTEVLRGTSFLAPSYPLPPVAPHACRYEAWSDGWFCPECGMPRGF